MSTVLSIIASLSPEACYDVAIQVLSRSQPISHITATHPASRKFV
ncbi:MAG: hypothetical protein ACFB16_23640 [Phormidesmis sp.]